jgi:hypothetical protein
MPILPYVLEIRPVTSRDTLGYTTIELESSGWKSAVSLAVVESRYPFFWHGTMMAWRILIVVILTL